MKIKTPTEFLPFNDGRAEIYEVHGNQLSEQIDSVRYGDRTVTAKKFFTARAASVKIDRVIHVPYNPQIDSTRQVIIDGIRYTIEQAQHTKTTNPPATILSLRKIGVMTDGNDKIYHIAR